MEKMTKRDYFTAIKAVAGVAENPEFVAFIDHELELLNKKNSKASGPNPEVVEFRNKVYTVIADAEGSISNAAIAKALGATSQKVTPAIKALVTEGKVKLAAEVKRVKYYAVA